VPAPGRFAKTGRMEINYDGLVGPSHNYAGLSYGNVASMSHKAVISNPREAVLQGLEKMKALMELGLHQGVFAPQERPDTTALRGLGFTGSDEAVLKSALTHAPELLAGCSSASSMWTANAATTCASADSEDGKVHFTAANLSNKFHRAIEHPTTSRVMRAMFNDERYFAHHSALPSSGATGDEGAANHTRFASAEGKRGFHFFVFGQIALQSGSLAPKKFPARQSLEASKSIARLHRLPEKNCFFAQQNPLAIDAGAFHNDVVGVGHRDVLFHHEFAYLESEKMWGELQRNYQAACGAELRRVMVSDAEVPLADAVKSYLFNSQLLTLPNGDFCLIAPTECQKTASVHAYIEKMLADSSSLIRQVRFFDLRQSMQNGGGPACLRFRVELNDAEMTAANSGCRMTPALYGDLVGWANKHYRDRLTLQDLADVKFLDESRRALDELTQIMKLGSVYPFQL
jgi:succinylarginine dihydrolase